MLLLRSPFLSSPNISSAIRQTPGRQSPPPPPPPTPILLAEPARAPILALSRSIRCLASSRRSEVPAGTAVEKGEEVAAVSEGLTERADEARPGLDASSGSHSIGIGSPSVAPFGLGIHRMSLGDQAFFLLAFIACTTSVAFSSLVIAAVPTLVAMRRAALSLARLADTAREELPSTMAAIRLSGMEISDLTLELSDLSQEIADGVSKSAQAVQAAEAGIRQIGALARRQTMSMIQERANLPNISFKPVVAGAAKKTSHVVGQAKRTLMSIITRSDSNSDSDNASDKVEI